MTGYGASLYGSDWYVASPFVENTERTSYICARIVKPITSVPPVIDTIYDGLAERFDLLQQGIQAFGLFNKITYAKGISETDNSILPSLDGVWGELYDLPRLTGESDDDYRLRLQTYVKVLTGSGTTPVCEEVLDVLTGYPGATRITSLWPAKALIDFTDVLAMRAARTRITLLNSILPGMFAAGVDYELLLPFLDSSICSYVSGTAEMESSIAAAIETTNELAGGIYALIALDMILNGGVLATVQADRIVSNWIKSAIRAEFDLPIGIETAIQGSPELPLGITSAIQSDEGLSCSQLAAVQGTATAEGSYYAAIAKQFELRVSILARICYVYELACGIASAVRAHQQTTSAIKVRIARRIE